MLPSRRPTVPSCHSPFCEAIHYGIAVSVAIISFCIVAFFLTKFAYDPILAVLDEPPLGFVALLGIPIGAGGALSFALRPALVPCQSAC